MSYSGVPVELTGKMDQCVQKIVKNGKTKDAAVALCKLSILNQKKLKKEKPYKTVTSKEVTDLEITSALEGKDYQSRHVFFSSSLFAKEEKKMNATKEGKMLKGVEIFKAGTYRGIEYKKSALDKMVAHFYYLKTHGVFPHVPVRADHPSFGFFGGGGDVIDKVGGYIEELRREGKKLVADFRITSDKMWNNIMEGTYINRSSEIGTYDDNEGTVYSPILYGVAWVDIPAVEGLSPNFSYSKDNQNIEFITLNKLTMAEEKKDVFPEEPSVDESQKADESTTILNEGAEEETGESPAAPEKNPEELEQPSGEEGERVANEGNGEALAKTADLSEFAKQFPKEAEALKKYKEEAFNLFFSKLEQEGKVLPKDKEKEIEFAKSLSEEQLAAYKLLRENSQVLVRLEKEVVESEQEELEVGTKEPTVEEKANKFIEETN